MQNTCVPGIDKELASCTISPMIPAFETTGLLPHGIYWTSWYDLSSRFGSNSHRARLLSGLKRGLEALSIAGCQTVYVNGSFVTSKVIPNDYDACWDVTGVNVAQLDTVFLDFKNFRASQKAKYFGEFFPAQFKAEASSPFRTYLNFFQCDKNTGGSKGIIGLALKGKL